MSHFINKTAVVVAAASLLLISLFGSSASAQAYPPILFDDFDGTDPIACNGQFYGTVSGGLAPYTIAHTITKDGVSTALTPFERTEAGPWTAPAGHVDYAVIADGTYAVSVLFTDANGSTATASFTATITDNCSTPIEYFGPSDSELLAAILASRAAAATPASVPATTPAVPATSPELAFTGGDVSLPVAAGAILIGSGGLMLLAANKRSRKED